MSSFINIAYAFSIVSLVLLYTTLEYALATTMTSVNGGYMLVSGLMTYLLANGTGPVKLPGMRP
jgi:hypothetical protein